ncbi:MAG TPA: DNA gyrase inhibitor YacG [Candidatus Binatia bacterium]
MRVKCPTCKTEVQWENNPHRPFCSERCRLIDLGAWATERHKIPAEEQDVDADDDDGDDQTRCN